MRMWIAGAILSLLLTAFCSPLAAQNNPVPYVNNPVVPAVIAPGGPGFMLAVNGAGFVNGAVVKWNGSARQTMFVSPTRLTAAILTTDIALATTVFVTVLNPSPGGGLSNSVFFQVTTPTTSLAYALTNSDLPAGPGGGSPSIEDPVALAEIDPSNVGFPHLVVVNGRCPLEIECVLQKASITFATSEGVLADQTFTGVGPSVVGSGDFNGDGILDLVTFSPINYSILLGTGNEGSLFPLHKDYPLPAGCTFPFAFGDFHQDGHLDLVLSGTTGICILPGNGDGTFGPATNYNLGVGAVVSAVGDFDGNGKLDLALSNSISNTISILLGNGDGTFQLPEDFASDPFPENMVTADFNGDGKLDLAVFNDNGNISIFLGNGDGTFQAKKDYPAGISIHALTMGDYNGDGVVDLAVTDSLCSGSTCPADGSVNVLLGNGDGTFQSPLNFAVGGQPGAITSGSFQFSGLQNVALGRLGFATANSQQNAISVFDAITTGEINSVPTISLISPTSALVNSGAFTLTVTGTNFVSGSIVFFGGQARTSTFVSATQLTAAIQAGDVSVAGTFNVFVANPAPGGGNSTSVAFSVLGPPPTISSLSPPSVVVGGPALTLTVNGSNFVTGAAVNFNGTSRLTTFVSSTQLTIAISAADIANQGTINISVTNPVGNGSAGGTSSTLPLSILPTNTQPVVGGLVPASTTAGSSAFTLILTGTGFTASSIVTFNSRTVSSAYVSATQLQASIPASAIAVAGTPFVTVANPGGVASVVATFTVNNPLPGASSLSPSSLPAGNAAITLNVTGTNFNSSSTALLNGSSRATTFVSSTSLTAGLTANDLAHSGTLNITVNNPAPGGGTTATLILTIEDFQLNAQTSTTSVTAGQPANFKFVVTPSNVSTANPVMFTATGLPSGATASFTPSPTVSAGSGATTVTLAITTTAHSAVTSMNTPRTSWPHMPSLLMCLFAALSVAFGVHALNGRACRIAPQFLLVSLLAIAAGMIACGGTGTTAQLNPATGTPAGTYPIVVTVTSGSGALTTTVMLTVM